MSGLGAASADGVYGLIAALGLTLVSQILNDWQVPLRLAGGAFLAYLGIRAFFARPPTDAPSAMPDATAPLQAYASTFALTITNPATIIAFSAVFLTLNIAEQAGGGVGALVVVAGVFSGSALWWLTLTLGVSLLRRFVNARLMLWINRTSGAVLIAFGVLAILSILLPVSPGS